MLVLIDEEEELAAERQNWFVKTANTIEMVGLYKKAVFLYKGKWTFGQCFIRVIQLN